MLTFDNLKERIIESDEKFTVLFKNKSPYKSYLTKLPGDDLLPHIKDPLSAGRALVEAGHSISQIPNIFKALSFVASTAVEHKLVTDITSTELNFLSKYKSTIIPVITQSNTSTIINPIVSPPAPTRIVELLDSIADETGSKAATDLTDDLDDDTFFEAPKSATHPSPPTSFLTPREIASQLQQLQEQNQILSRQVGVIKTLLFETLKTTPPSEKLLNLLFQVLFDDDRV